MDDSKRYTLKNQWDKIKRDLYVDNVLDELYSRQTITKDELELIRNKSSRLDGADCLLKIIIKKDNHAYDNFKNVLKKDYDWLSQCLQLTQSENDLQVTTEQLAFQDTLVLGNIPRQPPYYVKRTVALQNLQHRLEELEPCQRIVLYGMTGSGKSCLAAAAVKDPDLLQRSFKNRVFWINLGEVKEIYQLPMHMTLLIERLQNDSREITQKIRPVSIPPNQDNDSSFEIEMLKISLKNMFLNFREALLILDNVSLREATEAFDVGCKTLITTQVKDIILGNNTVYVPVEGGFTQKETLQLFAISLDTEVKKLPLLAEKLHNLCKGEPILISLIGSLLHQYKEDLLNSSKRWEYYIKKLTNKDNSLKRQLFNTISICIERLSPEMQKLYYNFSVFVEDVNITPQVMQTIWNLDDLYDVQKKMRELQNMSLIVSYYNQELQTYIYGVHDLFLAYLKKMQKDSIVTQHQHLIEAYKRVSNNNFANLPNDNYIYQYLGYHLKQAQRYDEFSVYFNLKFIGAKIKAIGTADLLRDYQIYKEYISHNDEILLKKLEEYTNFVKARGHDLYKYPYTDIIQCGLGQPKDSSVYKAALLLAKEESNLLYLQLQSPQESIYFTHTLDLQQDVSAACFTVNVSLILVGTQTGDIHLWEQSSNHKLYVFPGHTDSITHLQLSPDGDKFLSVSDDGCVKMWNLNGVVLRNSNGDIFDENGFNDNIPSPRTKQSNWKNIYETNTHDRIDRSKTCRLTEEYNTDRIISAAYAHQCDDSIVTGCFSGNVLVWNVERDPTVVCTIKGRGNPVTCVTFSSDDSLIIFCCDSTIFLHNATNGEFLSLLLNRTTINSLLIIPELESTLIAINEHSITMWTWSQAGLSIIDPTLHVLDNRQSKYLCGAITIDGMYLVVSSNDHYIRIWHLGTRKIVQEILNNKGLVVCLDTFYDDSNKAVHILLSGSDDKTVKQWHIQPTTPNKDTAKLLPIFDCYWNTSSGKPRIAVVNSLNKVQIMNGFNVIIESDHMKIEIKVVRFSLCGNKVAIGLMSGDIIEFDYKSRQSETLMKLHGAVVLLKYFNTGNNYINGINGSNPSSNSTILVGAADNGWITMYRNGRALCLIQPYHLSLFSNNVKQLPVIPIVQCFFLKRCNKLLTVSKNRIIKLWHEDASTILFGEKMQNGSNNGTVTMATVSPDQLYLAITLDNGCFEIYTLDTDNDHLSLIEEKYLPNPLTCCRFSHNGKILALGHDNGNIVIWSVQSKLDLGTLQLHKSSVRYLLFSPSPALILISVGDQIAWWDLTKMSDNSHNRFRRRSSSVKKKNLTIDLTAPMTNLDLGLWSNKEGKTDKPHLLSVIKVRGVFSTYISASHDFTSFFSIDQNGYPYIMEILS